MKELIINFLGVLDNKRNNERMKEKGFSLAELGIAMVILLIIATIATISYFVFIDDAKKVKSVEDANSIQTAVATSYAQGNGWSVDPSGTSLSAYGNPKVFKAIGGTLSSTSTDGITFVLEATSSTNGLIVSDEVLIDADNGTVTTGNITVDKTTYDGITASESAVHVYGMFNGGLSLVCRHFAYIIDDCYCSKRLFITNFPSD
ncbi:type II secretion system protein [Virgibacillus sp. DJP39]|uniref:type II secretion system protein n=1 Tax=Virgibacillus sp. DJP39 TaxID=3409790 RepID=UPI003BB4BB6F